VTLVCAFQVMSQTNHIPNWALIFVPGVWSANATEEQYGRTVPSWAIPYWQSATIAAPSAAPPSRQPAWQLPGYLSLPRHPRHPRHRRRPQV